MQTKEAEFHEIAVMTAQIIFICEILQAQLSEANVLQQMKHRGTSL